MDSRAEWKRENKSVECEERSVEIPQSKKEGGGNTWLSQLEEYATPGLGVTSSSPNGV